MNYSYNVALAPVQPGHDGGKPLIVDALEDPDRGPQVRGAACANAPIKGRPNKALGYDEGELPGFALPPPTLTDLRILHGSCRRPAFTYPDDDKGERSFDGFAWVDDLILEWRRGTATATALDPNVRPHQLFLTGDQIYADDVSSVMLPMLNRAQPRADRRARAAADALPAEGRRREPRGVRQRAEAVRVRHAAEVRRRPQAARSQDPLAGAEAGPPRPRAPGPLLRPRVPARLPAGRTRIDPQVVLDTDAKGLRHWPADLKNFPARSAAR